MGYIFSMAIGATAGFSLWWTLMWFNNHRRSHNAFHERIIELENAVAGLIEDQELYHPRRPHTAETMHTLH